MSEVPKTANKKFRLENLGERDWWPRCCVKMPSLYKMYLRNFLSYLVRTRVESGTDYIIVEVNEQDYSSLVDIVNHLDNARWIKSSVEKLTTYGGKDGKRN